MSSGIVTVIVFERPLPEELKGPHPVVNESKLLIDDVIVDANAGR